MSDSSSEDEAVIVFVQPGAPASGSRGRGAAIAELEAELDEVVQVRKTPSWRRSWANFSLL
jgi:hypothetical protein